MPSAARRSSGTCPRAGASTSCGPFCRGKSPSSPVSAPCRPRPSIASTCRPARSCARGTRWPSCPRLPEAEVYLTPQPIDLPALLAGIRPSDGALCLFVGIVRNANAGRETLAIEYQAYGTMAELEMAKLAESLVREFPDVEVRMKHRIGRLSVGEASVDG